MQACHQPVTEPCAYLKPGGGSWTKTSCSHKTTQCQAQHHPCTSPHPSPSLRSPRRAQLRRGGQRQEETICLPLHHPHRQPRRSSQSQFHPQLHSWARPLGTVPEAKTSTAIHKMQSLSGKRQKRPCRDSFRHPRKARYEAVNLWTCVQVSAVWA